MTQTIATPAALALAPNGAPSARAIAPGLTSAPLTLRADMAKAWRNYGKEGVDFDRGANDLVRAHEADGKAEDIVLTNLRHWTVVPHMGHFAMKPVSGYRPEIFPMRWSALSDLCRVLDAGKVTSFLRDRMPPALQIGPLVHLLRNAEEGGRKVVLRTRNGEVTAVVSGSYAPLSAADMVSMVRASLVATGGLDRVRVRAVATGMVDALRLSLPGMSRAVKVGDVTEAMVDFENSEFADSAFYVHGGLWRLTCENGMRRYERLSKTRFNHSGKMERLHSAVREAIPAVIASTTGMLDRWSQAVDVMLDDLMAQIEALQEHDGYTMAEAAAVEASARRDAGIAALPQGQPEPISLYDFANAMTDAAKADDPAGRLRKEAVAGKVLARGGAV